jgi:hypothetical protein
MRISRDHRVSVTRIGDAAIARVTDVQGNLVDNTNFVMAGPEKSVFAAFEAAG